MKSAFEYQIFDAPINKYAAPILHCSRGILVANGNKSSLFILLTEKEALSWKVKQLLGREHRALHPLSDVDQQVVPILRSSGGRGLLSVEDIKTKAFVLYMTILC